MLSQLIYQTEHQEDHLSAYIEELGRSMALDEVLNHHQHQTLVEFVKTQKLKEKRMKNVDAQNVARLLADLLGGRQLLGNTEQSVKWQHLQSLFPEEAKRTIVS